MAKPDRKPDPDFEPDYDVADVDYDDASQASYDESSDPDYEQGTQTDYDTEYADDDGDDGNNSQEWRHRPQK